MVKDKSSKTKKDGNASKDAVLNLKIDGSYPDAEVREVTPASTDAFQTPCSVSGLMAGVSGGTLGYAFGFAGYWFRMRLQGNLRGAFVDGWGSAKTFGIMGGLYAAVSCFMLRLRQKQDAWNGAASGCATGLALGWSQGPASALQSCVMLGIFSYFIDGFSGDTANASDLQNSTNRSRTRADPSINMPRTIGGTRKKEMSPVEMLLSPAMPLLHALNPCRGGRCIGLPGSNAFGSSTDEEILGCKVGGNGNRMMRR